MLANTRKSFFHSTKSKNTEKSFYALNIISFSKDLLFCVAKFLLAIQTKCDKESLDYEYILL